MELLNGEGCGEPSVGYGVRGVVETPYRMESAVDQRFLREIQVNDRP
jgi:hypothetical protein